MPTCRRAEGIDHPPDATASAVVGLGPMANWAEIEAAEPEFARAVRVRFEAGKHKTLATLRADGSPRISGTEADFVGDDLWFGSMPRARKAADLRRDPRFAIHSASADSPEWTGDAKLSGVIEEVNDPELVAAYLAGRGGEEGEPEPPGDFHLFRAEITEAVLVGLNEARDRLVIEHWHEGRGLERIERE